MSSRWVDDLVNPQLLKFQEDFSLSDYAFVVQCSNVLAPLVLQRNLSLTLPRYSDLETIDDEVERETPGVDDLPTAWLFPRWRPQKDIYIFGTFSSYSDILIPHDTATSRRHFAIYLSRNGVWMARNLSRYGTWINEDLLGLPEPGQPAVETTLNPEVPNKFRAGKFECFIHTIPHTAMASHNERVISMLLELERLSEGTRTTSATESASAISRPSIIQTERYHYLRENYIVVQSLSQVCRALHKETDQYHIAKIYSLGERSRALAQFEMMLRFKACISHF